MAVVAHHRVDDLPVGVTIALARLWQPLSSRIDVGLYSRQTGSRTSANARLWLR